MKPVKWTPHKYQTKAVRWVLERFAALLLLSPGLGKTSIVIAAIKVLKNKGVFKGALVLAPLRVAYSVWPAEVEKWADFKGLSVCVLHGKNKDLDLATVEADIYITNYESIEWLFGSAVNRKLLFKKVDTLVVDELSKMKHTNTKRFKAIKPYLNRFERRWGLTGSPASNGLLDLFGQVYTIDMGKALGQYITHFKNKYFYSTGYGGYTWALQPGADKLIYDAVKPLALTMQAEDYLDLPSIVPVNIYVELPPKVRKMYDEMEDELFAEFENSEYIALTAAAASMKCEQIANGAIYDDKVDPKTGLPIMGKRAWNELHSAKLDALEEVLGELQGQPSLWAYHFKHDLERVVKLLGKDTPHCDHSPKIVDGIFKQWNRNELPYLFGHPGSVGHGNNLQGGDCGHVGFFHITWDYDLYDQFIKRVKRQGNKVKTVFVYHIIAKNTVDEAKMAALHSKGKGQQALMDALKAYRKNRSRG